MLLFFLAVGFATGIACGWSWGLVGAVGASLVALLVCLTRRAAFAPVVLAIWAGGLAAHHERSRPSPIFSNTSNQLQGIVRRPPERLDRGRTRVVLRADDGADLQVEVGSGEVGLLPGDEVRFSARVHEPT